MASSDSTLASSPPVLTAGPEPLFSDDPPLPPQETASLIPVELRPSPRDIISGIAPHVFDERRRRPSQSPPRSHRRHPHPPPGGNPCHQLTSTSGHGWYYGSPLRRSIVVSWDENKNDYSIYLQKGDRRPRYGHSRHASEVSPSYTPADSNHPPHPSSSSHTRSRSDPSMLISNSKGSVIHGKLVHGLTCGHPLTRTVGISNGSSINLVKSSGKLPMPKKNNNSKKARNSKKQKLDPFDLDFASIDSSSDDSDSDSDDSSSICSSSSSSTTGIKTKKHRGDLGNLISMEKFRWQKLKMDSKALKNIMIKIKFPRSNPAKTL